MKFLTTHLNKVNEGYFEHMAHAFSFFGVMFLGSIACLLHGIFPFLFEKTGSSIITKLHDRMVTNRIKSTATEDLATADAKQLANAN